MKIIHMAPLSQGWIVEGTGDTQLVVSVLEDDNDEVVCIVDTSTGKYYINRIIDKDAIWKFAPHNFAKIENDDAFDAYHKFFFDNGLGIAIDGMNYNFTGKLKS